MATINRFALLLMYFLIPSTGRPADVYSPILDGMTPGSITIIGELHQQPESILLIRQMLATIAERHQCLTLGLEIADSQQPIINQMMKGIPPASSIKIPSAIDHPGLRELIADLTQSANQSSCLQLLAIDTGIETQYDRDEWMAKRLSELPQDRPILVLLGGLHALKRVNWTVPTGKPSVAEILDRKGYHVKTFPQRWLPEKCPDHRTRSGRFVSAESPDALSILNETLIALLNAKPHKSAVGVVDGMIVWSCPARK